MKVCFPTSLWVETETLGLSKEIGPIIEKGLLPDPASISIFVLKNKQMSEKNFENPEFTNKGPTHNINTVGYETHMFCPDQYKNLLLYP